jgi:peptidoglycan/LPS O-acetylase OafA/YrhL
MPVWQFSPELRPVGLLVGCRIAPIQNIKTNQILAALLLSFLFAIGFFADLSIYTQLGAPLVASLATAVLIVCLQRPSAVSGILASPPLRYTGKISYGLYLYHWPIFILGEHWTVHSPFHVGAIGLVVLTYSSAAASYEFIEKPCLQLKDRLGARRMPVAVAAG